jgi:hypothetical protein
MPFKDIISSLWPSARYGLNILDHVLLDTATRSLSVHNIMAMFKGFRGLGFTELAHPFRLPVVKIHWEHVICVLNRIRSRWISGRQFSRVSPPQALPIHSATCSDANQ